MSSNLAIKVDGISKCYQIYKHPLDRLKQFIFPHIKSIFGIKSLPYYREFWALNNISFEINKGETVGIIGRNGSGKSTLLQIIAGTINPTKGSIKTNGRIAALLELGSGFNPEFTGLENIYLNATILGLRKREIDGLLEDILSFAEIGDFIKQPVKIYSSGMLVRLAFAVSAHVMPDILIVDEALTVGDELFQRKCLARIESLKKAGATILFVSHSAELVKNLCDHVILIDHGEQLSAGTPKLIVGQ
jgi:lipopolysaccharide transport system ATP-binding protein